MILAAILTASRMFVMDVPEQPSRVFEVRYRYDTADTLVPLTIPRGPTHYWATVTIREKVNGKFRKVNGKLWGWYVPEGCFEDNPEEYVKRALARARRARKGRR